MAWTTTLVILAAAAAAPGPTAASWRDAPALAALFAPAGPRAPAYRASVSPLDLDAVLRALADDPALVRAPGAWEPRALPPTDAFGLAGRYDRLRVARLYGSRQPRVARGARLADDGALETWTLISPYPDATLRRLEPGTLLLVLRRR
ncbi:MAG: hypothetical protein HYU37_08920 [Acidobacteria bacterium]|nr:hypothetical protein [Acidobacteriota bacterium]